jgi:hypothetical protein
VETRGLSPEPRRWRISAQPTIEFLTQTEISSNGCAGVTARAARKSPARSGTCSCSSAPIRTRARPGAYIDELFLDLGTRTTPQPYLATSDQQWRRSALRIAMNRLERLPSRKPAGRRHASGERSARLPIGRTGGAMSMRAAGGRRQPIAAASGFFGRLFPSASLRTRQTGVLKSPREVGDDPARSAGAGIPRVRLLARGLQPSGLLLACDDERRLEGQGTVDGVASSGAFSCRILAPQGGAVLAIRVSLVLAERGADASGQQM